MRPIVLTGARLATVSIDGDEQGVEFDFADGAIQVLAPGQHMVVVEDAECLPAFVMARVLPVAGEWSGGLDNGGESLTVMAYDDSLIQQFRYNDSGDWPGRADGNGSTLGSDRCGGRFKCCW